MHGNGVGLGLGVGEVEGEPIAGPAGKGAR